MDPNTYAELVSYWGDFSLTSASRMDEAQLARSSKEFLATYGLPRIELGAVVVGCHDLTRVLESRSALADLGDNERVNLADFWEFGRFYHGSLCLRSNSEPVWLVSPNGASAQVGYVNASVQQFVLSLYVWLKFAYPPRDLDDTPEMQEEVQTLTANLQSIDSTALSGDECFWSGILEDYKIQMSSEYAEEAYNREYFRSK